MPEVKAGDAVLLYQQDGSPTPRLVVNVISQTEVQLVNIEVGSAFNALTAPVYIRGTEPGQWEPMHEEPPEALKRFGEGLRIASHPTMKILHSLLNIKLSDDIQEVFSMIERIYADKDIRSPFYEVQHHDVPYNDVDYFYNLLTMGVQEGLRSTLYFLLQFLRLSEMVKVQAAAVIADVKPSYNGSFGIAAHALDANYEGFVLLSRATLDRLTYLLKYYFRIKNKDPNLDHLRRNLGEHYKDNKRAQQIVETIKNHSAYLNTQLIGKDQPTERNRLAHEEYVGFATPNIIYTSQGSVRVVLIYGGDLQADATEELTDRFNRLKLFIIDILNEFFGKI